MDRRYWETVAKDYEAEIFDVSKHDKKGLVAGQIERYGAASKVASDYGCGIGRYLPPLAKHFKTVRAYDLSSRCIARAKQECQGADNVTFKTMDLAKPPERLPRNDFALCVNTVIMPSRKCRTSILDTMADRLRSGGQLVLVVPALESVLFAHAQRAEWLRRKGARSAASAKLRKNFTADSLRKGIIQIDGVPTKHYMKEEMAFMLNRRKLRIVEIKKIEYPWSTEFDSPPRWMKKPCPWDWLAVAEKA